MQRQGADFGVALALELFKSRTGNWCAVYLLSRPIPAHTMVRASLWTIIVGGDAALEEPPARLPQGCRLGARRRRRRCREFPGGLAAPAGARRAALAGAA